MKTSTDFREPIPCEILEENPLTTPMSQGSSFRDFLRFVAIRRSLSMANEYEKLSDCAVPEEQKSFFSDMVELKQNEVECLRRYRFDGRIVSLDAKNPPSMAFEGEEVAFQAFDTLEDACRFAMKKDLNEYCLYLRLADLEEEVMTKRLFLFLVRLQKCSLNYVQNRLELLASLHELKGNADAPDVCRNYSFEQTA